MNEINYLFIELKKKIEAAVPVDSKERSTALAFLTTAQLWANKVITYPDK